VVDIPSALDDPVTRAIVGTFLALSTGFLAYWLKALSTSGVVATAAVGGAVVAGAGWWAGAVLVIYFVTSSALSSHSRRYSGDSGQARGKQRDAVQVLANGGVPAVLALAILFGNTQAALSIACLGAIAGAAADTWATEIGRFSATSPRLITTWKPVIGGTSGAVTPLGTLGSIAGATLIALVSAIGWRLDLPVQALSITVGAVGIFLAGAVGSFTDSLVGATIQERRWCPVCHVSTEQRLHVCGSPTFHSGGWAWMTNDLVNTIAVAASGITGLLIGIVQTS
jgi:uncharacterized protein (TIGR00297 family)